MTDGSRWITLADDADPSGDGWTLAVKDNIDVAGLPTTAGCPSFATVPAVTAPAVQRLIDAGATVLGKTNLDQFATGLVGTRSPYGPVESPIAPGMVAGGSSSGSAAAVAAGEATLGIGTDTAGSGRVPAGFCGVVGLKGTRGWVPNTGVVPACPSFDCTTVFSRSVAEGAAALRTMAGPDHTDPSSRTPRISAVLAPVERAGIPKPAILAECDDRTRAAFDMAVGSLREAGIEVVPVDLDAYLDAAQLLYGGAFVAERYASVGEFLDTEPDDADPTVAAIIRAGAAIDAVAYIRDQARLAVLRRQAAAVWDDVQVVVTPTTPFHPSLVDVAADPVGVNTALGRFVSGCNLVDWCAAAVPVTVDDHPVGVQVLGEAWTDERVWSTAAILTGEPDPASPSTGLRLAVCGTHLRGEPLHHQLTDLGARFVSEARTAPAYRFVVLDGAIAKPGLVRDVERAGAIEVEVYELDPAAFGTFVAGIPAPLGVGTIDLDDGTAVQGFLCEAYAAAGAADITALGSWRRHRRGGT